MIKHILQIADDAAQGLRNPLEVYVELKSIEKALEQCIESVKPLAITEADKHGEKSFERYGATISKSRAAGRWDYSEIAQWKSTKAELTQIEAMAKDAYKLNLKGQTITDEDGVVIMPGKYTEGADIITIKLKKQ